MSKTVADVVKIGAEVDMVDFRFTDLPGMWQHFSMPARELTEEKALGLTALLFAAFRKFTSRT